METTYHSGEIEVQKMAGETQMAQRNEKIIGDAIIRGAINFIEKQPTAILTSVDAQGGIWVSLLVGDFGFVKVADEQTLTFDKSKIHSTSADIFYQNIQNNPEVGSLFIELDSRRRYRVNGKIESTDEQFILRVQEAYPNCPKYIQRRVVSLPEHFQATRPEMSQGQQLGETEKFWMSQADTFFVGSQSIEGKVDASHRGGNAGFVEVLEGGVLRIPDYQGNSMYNTLGNLVQNPKAGLLFIDFEKGETLQLTGKAELAFGQDSEADLEKSTGTGRFWLFRTEQWMRTRHHHQVAWEFLDYSPFNP